MSLEVFDKYELATQEAIDYLQNFLTGLVNNTDILEEATNVARAEVELALLDGGYDTNIGFFRAIINSTSVQIVDKGNMEFDFDVVFDFDNKPIIKEWELKGQSKKGRSEIGSADVAEFIDLGRPAYTIVGGANTKHKLLAFGSEPYDPYDKSNTIIPRAHIPELPATNYLMRAKAAVNVWSAKKYATVYNEILRNLVMIVSNRIYNNE